MVASYSRVVSKAYIVVGFLWRNNSFINGFNCSVWLPNEYHRLMSLILSIIFGYDTVEKLATIIHCVALTIGMWHFETMFVFYVQLHEGPFTQMPLGFASWESLDSNWLRVSWALALGLHEGSFELQPTTFSVNEKSTWNPTWQACIMWEGSWR